MLNQMRRVLARRGARGFADRMHSYERQIRFADTDMAGVAHFSRLVVLFEETWHDWLLAMGASVHPDRAPGGAEPVGWPVTALQVDFARPARFGDAVRVEMTGKVSGGRRLVLSFRLLCGGEELAAGSLTVAPVKIEHGAFIPCDVPEVVAAGLAT